MLVRVADAAVDRIHSGSKYTGCDNSLAKVGRVRAGRRDTGKLVYENIRFSRTSALPKELAEIGFAFTGIHWFKQHRPGKQNKWVVVVSFNDQSIKDAQRAVVPNDDELAAMITLCEMTWEGTYIWQNVTGVATINCLHLRPDGKPLHEIVIRDRQLLCIKV